MQRVLNCGNMKDHSEVDHSEVDHSEVDHSEVDHSEVILTHKEIEVWFVQGVPFCRSHDCNRGGQEHEGPSIKAGQPLRSSGNPKLLQ